MPQIANETPNSDTIIMRQPDDWHLHLRDGDILTGVAAYTARQFARAIIMPNLTPPVTTTDAARDYRGRILAALGDDHDFTPLMTAYLTDDIAGDELRHGFEEGVFTAAKLYPANATTNSSHGVTNVKNIYSALEVMQDIGMPLLIHGEVTDAEIDIFDREAVFIERTMRMLVADFPGLKIVFEHITTKDAADFVLESGPNMAATITPHHLKINRNAMLVGGIQPHNYCLPVAKRELHRLALRKAATSGSTKFFLGTDSAPHPIGDKESACGCAGIFNAPFAIESYAKAFEEEGALDRLESFASLNGPAFYSLPVNEKRIILEKRDVAVPEEIDANGYRIKPFHAGETLQWHFAGFADA